MADPRPQPTTPYQHFYRDDDRSSRFRACALDRFELAGVGDWHENPAPQWIVVLSGRWWIEAIDGTRIEQGPGEMSFGGDQNCVERDGRKGHRSGTVGDEPCRLMTVRLHRDPLGPCELR